MTRILISITSVLFMHACSLAGEGPVEQDNTDVVVISAGGTSVSSQGASTFPGSTSEKKVIRDEDFVVTYPSAYINEIAPLATWQPAPNAKDYDLVISLTENCKTPVMFFGDIIETTQQLKPMPEGVFYFCLYAIQNGGRLLEPISGPLKFVIDITPPLPPQINEVKETVTTNTTPSFSWQEAPGADLYDLELATDVGCKMVVQKQEDIAHTEKTVDPLQEGIYYVCLTAKDFAGNKTAALNNGEFSFRIDTTPPKVLSVGAANADGSYRVGSAIDITLTFSEKVTVDSEEKTPSFLVETGAIDQTAVYLSGSGSEILVFRYMVTDNDNSVNLDIVDALGQLQLNGATIRDDAGIDIVDLSIPVKGVGSLAYNKALVIDNRKPLITQVSADVTDGSYSTLAPAISIIVKFDEMVFVDTNAGEPYLMLAGGGSAAYTSGSGTNQLVFAYKIGDLQMSARLDVDGNIILNGATIRDLAGNDIVNEVLVAENPASLASLKNIIIDTLAPTVTDITSTSDDGYYAVGASINVGVTFSENIYVTGNPTLELNSGGSAFFASVSGETIVFTYTVATGENSSHLDGSGAISCGMGCEITDLAQNAALLTYPTGAATANGLANNKNIVIDTTPAEVINITSTTANGAYKKGDVDILIDVSYNEEIHVTGTPTLALTSNGIALFESFSVETITFRYTILEGENIDRLDTEGAISCEAPCTIYDNANNAAVLTTITGAENVGALAYAKNIVIDTLAPLAEIVTSTTADDTYKAADSVEVRVVFNEDIVVTGTPMIALNSLGSATYSSLIDGNIAIFTYIVAGGQNSSDLDTTGSIVCGEGSSIEDLAGNSANLTLLVGALTIGSLANAKALVIDTTPPTAQEITTATEDGGYNHSDDPIFLVVTFDEDIVVTGEPILALNSGGTATYFSSSGSTVTFRYVIGEGHNTLRLDASGTIGCLGPVCTLRDIVGNDANLNLPTGADAGGALANSADIIIDTSRPTVTSVSSTTSSGAYKEGDIIAVTVTFSETLQVTPGDGLTLALNSSGIAHYDSATGGSITFIYLVGAGENAAALDSEGVISCGDGCAILDGVGNLAILTLPVGAATFGALANSKDITIDTTQPQVTGVSSSTIDGAYKAGAAINITVTYSESVFVTGGNPSIDLDSGGSASWQSASGSNALSFTYTVSADENSIDLDTNGSITLGEGVQIRDAAGNNALLALPTGALAGSLMTNKNIVIDTISPSAFSITGPASPVGSINPTLSWSASWDADLYDVVVSLEPDCSIAEEAYTDLVTLSQNVGPLANNTYYFCISAKDNAGNATMATNNGYPVEVETSTLHVTYTRNDAGTYRLKYAKKISVGAWSPMSVVDSSSSELGRSALTLDANDKPHLSYVVHNGTVNEVKYSRLISEWEHAFLYTLSAGSHGGYYNSIAYDHENQNVHVVHYLYDEIGKDILRRSAGKITDGVWSSRSNDDFVMVDSSLNFTYFDTAVAMDINHEAHVVYSYSDTVNAYLQYRNQNLDWDTPIENISVLGCDHYKYATITTDGAGYPHVAFACYSAAGACEVYYGNRMNGSWSTPIKAGTILPEACSFETLIEKHRPAIAIDSVGCAHIAYVDEDAARPMYTTTRQENPTSCAATFASTVINEVAGGWDATLALDEFNNAYIFYLNDAANIVMSTKNSGSWISSAVTSSGDIHKIGDAAISGVRGNSSR